MLECDDKVLARGHLILSEPLDDCDADWRLLDESSFVEVRGEQISVSEFRPH